MDPGQRREGMDLGRDRAPRRGPGVHRVEGVLARLLGRRPGGRARNPWLPRSRLPAGRFEVSIVAPADVPAAARQLPEGTVVFVVRADAPERATRVTHAGLVVSGPGGKPLIRHATSSRGVESVIQEPVERFVRRQLQAYPGWPVEGLSFFAIRDASARVRALVARPAAAPAAGEAPAASPPAGL